MASVVPRMEVGSHVQARFLRCYMVVWSRSDPEDTSCHSMLQAIEWKAIAGRLGLTPNVWGPNGGRFKMAGGQIEAPVKLSKEIGLGGWSLS